MNPSVKRVKPGPLQMTAAVDKLLNTLLLAELQSYEERMYLIMMEKLSMWVSDGLRSGLSCGF